MEEASFEHDESPYDTPSRSGTDVIEESKSEELGVITPIQEFDTLDIDEMVLEEARY